MHQEETSTVPMAIDYDTEPSTATFDENVAEGVDPTPVFVGTAQHVWFGRVGPERKAKLRFALRRRYHFMGRDHQRHVGERFYDVELWEENAEPYEHLIVDGAYVGVGGEPLYYEEEYTPKGSSEKKLKKGYRLIDAYVHPGYIQPQPLGPSGDDEIA